jgi:hypothetical protein
MTQQKLPKLPAKQLKPALSFIENDLQLPTEIAPPTEALLQFRNREPEIPRKAVTLYIAMAPPLFAWQSRNVQSRKVVFHQTDCWLV